MMLANLDRWFVRFKVTAPEGQPPAQGRVNPANGQTLFTPETRPALEEAKKKAQFILDVLLLEEIYQPVEAPTCAKHSLPRYRCARATESTLESFHADQAMFGNTGMAIGLIDTINHAGLARHNTKIRWRLLMDLLSSAEQDEVLFYFWRLVRHYDHSRLKLVNRMARSAGVDHDVHQDVRPLPEDNRERFYDDYYLESLEQEKTILVTKDTAWCQCGACAGSMALLPFQMLLTMTAPAASTCEEQDVATASITNAATALPSPTTTTQAPVTAPPQPCPPFSWPSALMAHPPPIYYYLAPYQQLPFVLAHQQQLLAHQQQVWSQPTTIVSQQPRRRRRTPKVVEYRCCKKLWKYHVVDKPEGRMGAPPHCLDCPVQKPQRHPNRGPKGPR
jgi:hypothetical protein